MTHRTVALRAAMVCALTVAAAARPAGAQLPFFPGAEGYGGTWSGAAPAGGWLSNATVYHVTNLDDSGPGSFRGAFAENSANKIIVFDVGGTIQLTSDNIDIKNLSNYYIAGQTAPSPVTIYGDMVQLTHSANKENRNVALRYLSFRKGTGDNSDAITFAGSGLGTNLILDHVSASWSEDEILSVANNNTNITVQYSIIHDALVSNHAYGSLIRPRIDSNVSFHHNLYAHNASRQARFGTYNGETLTADFRNNVIYNWRDRASYAGGSSENAREFADVNYVGNYLVAGPGTTGVANRAFWVDQNVDARVYQSDNFIDSDKTPNGPFEPNGSNTNWAMFFVSPPPGGAPQRVGTLTQMATPFATAPVTTQTAADAYRRVLESVGNSANGRDAIDQRVINNVINFSGPATIGAAAPPAAELAELLARPMIARPAGWDSDGDGMPDAWETKHGLNPNSPAATPDWKLDFDNDGYINLIEYVNEAGEFPAPTPLVFTGATNNRYAQIANWKTDDGGVTAGSNWQPSRFDEARIVSGTAVVDAVGQRAWQLAVAPLSGGTATLNITGGWLEVGGDIHVEANGGTSTVNQSGGIVRTMTLGVDGVGPGVAAYNLTGGTLEVNMLGNGNFTFTGGTLTADVILTSFVNNGGVLSPGYLQNSAVVMGDFTNASGSVKLELAGAAVGQFDRLFVDEELTAGGVLDVDLVGGYTPAIGASFDVLHFTTATGEFAFDLPVLPTGRHWNASRLLTTGELLVVNSADFDADGDVDGADLLVWQRGLGVAGQKENSRGDADANGVVDALDLDMWRTQVGIISPATTNAPEPTSAFLVSVGAFVVRRRRRRFGLAA